MTEHQYESNDLTNHEKVFLLMTREKIDEELKLFRSHHNDINYPTLTIAEIEKRDKHDEKKLRNVLNYMHQLSPNTFGDYEPVKNSFSKTSKAIKDASYAICGVLFAVFLCVFITEILMQICVYAKHLF
ncbi:hypothetical protein [Burkholderia vietnamiensis]|uniref:hypothetical protein n=1 Tax=Burkholderia vietnamiensis TaxID=60552 RepID=UPI0012DB77B7|nr:hypothetical protein [Burkholderia vietnamiensis]UKV74413.1 hypothetical protein FOC29_23900 [Burkholderia vietnamiensis]